MHIDARTLDNNTLIEGDLCIVGAGAAGITIALQFIGTPLKVILLEGGGFNYEASMQDLYKGRSTGLPYFSLESSRLHYFGGTTGHWAGYCSEYDDIDFARRSWIPGSGWPIGKKDLAPYYDKAAGMLELQTGTPDIRLLDSSLKLDRQLVHDKMWYFSPPVRFGKKYRQPVTDAANVHLYTYANVTDIITVDNGKFVKEVVVKNLAGKQHTVRAKKVVLACCAIQNARLLLASGKGIGNSNDQVGRYFMEHLEMNAADLFLPRPLSLDIYRLQFFYTKVRAELALNEVKQSELKILNGTAALEAVPEPEPEGKGEDKLDTGSSTSAEDPAASLKGWEDAEKYYESGEYVKETFSKTRRFTLFTRMEQSPNRESRIMLDKERDPLGMPRVVLHWQLTELEKNSYRKFLETLGQAFGSAGMGRIRMHEWLHNDKDTSWPSHLAGGWHHMGTTRMHENIREGVVDKNCKVHEVDNLYIAGSSCFPTAGSANPTYTIVAMSLRLADHLKSQ